MLSACLDLDWVPVLVPSELESVLPNPFYHCRRLWYLELPDRMSWVDFVIVAQKRRRALRQLKMKGLSKFELGINNFYPWLNYSSGRLGKSRFLAGLKKTWLNS